jgi:dTDP-4-dehydrorhamnose reductase
MHLVTGGAGFIGSHIVRALNERGIEDIFVVDDLAAGEKFTNLRDCRIADYMDKVELRRALEAGRLPGRPTRIYHQGACTDTLERDGRYLMENNFGFSKLLLQRALEAKVPFVYASTAAIYGECEGFTEVPRHERPLNVYAYSKLVFDQHVRRLLPSARATSTSTGPGKPTRAAWPPWSTTSTTSSSTGTWPACSKGTATSPTASSDGTSSTSTTWSRSTCTSPKDRSAEGSTTSGLG